MISDSISDVSSFFDDCEEDLYSTSIITTSQCKDPNELVDDDLIKLLGYISKLHPPSEQEITKKSVEFGEITRMKTLIFDLDETLIHSTLLLSHKEPPVNKNFDIELSNGGIFSIAVRPYTEKCLAHLSELYEIAIFTAGEQTYADKIIDLLDPEGKYISHRLYR